MDTVAALKACGIDNENSGACAGPKQWLNTTGTRITSINPANEKVLAAVTTCSDAQQQTVIAHAERAFVEWRNIPAPKRGDIIRQIGQRLRGMKDALGTLVSLETGKSKQEGDGEVQEMIDMADFAVGQSRMLYGHTMPSERPQHRLYEQWHPLGIVGVITAFNFPVAVWAWNAFLSAICGNVVIWKPSPKAPLCAIAMQHLCNEILAANHCPAVFNFFLPESNNITQQFLQDTRVPLVSFTGSCAVGREVGVQVASRMGKCLLELGGNNAIIIDETADKALAVQAVVFGAVGTAGQRCTTTRRVFIHETIFDTFCQQLVTAYQQLAIGNPLAPEHLMGPLIDKQAVNHYLDAIKQIKQVGATLLYGGNTLPGPGFYVEPTLVTHISANSPLVQSETFAPILYCFPFATLTEAIEQQNNVKQGLSSALFTQNLINSEHFLSAMGSDCGIANVNIGTSGAEIGGAFGGEKETGGGREAGSDAWKAYMRRQTNTINWGKNMPLAQDIQFKLTD